MASVTRRNALKHEPTRRRPSRSGSSRPRSTGIGRRCCQVSQSPPPAAACQRSDDSPGIQTRPASTSPGCRCRRTATGPANIRSSCSHTQRVVRRTVLGVAPDRRATAHVDQLRNGAFRSPPRRPHGAPASRRRVAFRDIGRRLRRDARETWWTASQTAGCHCPTCSHARRGGARPCGRACRTRAPRSPRPERSPLCRRTVVASTVPDRSGVSVLERRSYVNAVAA